MRIQGNGYFLTINENSQLDKLEAAVVGAGVTLVEIKPPTGDLVEAVYKIDLTSEDQLVKLKNFLDNIQPHYDYTLQTSEEYFAHSLDKERQGRLKL